MKYNLSKQEKKIYICKHYIEVAAQKKKIDKLHYSGKGGFSLLRLFSRFNGKKQICGWYHNGARLEITNLEKAEILLWKILDKKYLSI